MSWSYRAKRHDFKHMCYDYVDDLNLAYAAIVVGPMNEEDMDFLYEQICDFPNIIFKNPFIGLSDANIVSIKLSNVTLVDVLDEFIKELKNNNLIYLLGAYIDDENKIALRYGEKRERINGFLKIE